MSSNETDRSNESLKLEERLQMMKEHHRHHPKRLLFVPLFLALFAVKAAAILYLWNALVPDLFSGPMLNYPKAFGLMVLAKLLFGGFHRHGHRHGPWGGHHHWKERLWHGLSHEDRSRLRQEFKKRLKEGTL